LEPWSLHARVCLMWEDIRNVEIQGTRVASWNDVHKMG